jgi:hypothetical protein
MRIISKFRDYYDSVSSFGIDLECVYAREPKTIEFKKIAGNTTLKKYPHFSHNIRSYYNHSLGSVSQVTPMVLGFCGQLIPLIKVSYNKEKMQSTEDIYFYDLDSYMTFMKEYNAKFSSYSLSMYNYRNEVSFDVMSERSVKEFFSYNFPELQDCFAEYHCPIFLYKNKDAGYIQTLETNVELKTLQFGKVKDPATCFQEIFMYLSGVLGNKEKEIVRISDKDMLKQKGFDNYSFKKLPTKHK